MLELLSGFSCIYRDIHVALEEIRVYEAFLKEKCQSRAQKVTQSSLRCVVSSATWN